MRRQISEMATWWLMTLALSVAAAAAAWGCELSPGPGGADGAGGASGATAPKSPGDNFYRLIVNGEVERYEPGKRYVVTLVGSRTHDVVQQFTRFRLVAQPHPRAPAHPAAPHPPHPPLPRRAGEFQLFADTLSKFDEECSNAVVEADELPKTEVQVMWRAPATGAGCVLLKAMVYESASRWFAEDGQLTKRVCEDTSLQASDCCACDDAKYKMVFEGLWSPQTHPKDFPTQALWLTHFSDVIGATHPKGFSFWGEGQIATDGFRSLAEWGSVGLLERELRQQGGKLRSLVKAPGLWHPRVNANTSAAFTVDRKRHLLSLASMFGPSPDWVVGVSGLELCLKNCSWVQSLVVDLHPYDAGTDNGISYMSPNSETVPREKMYRITPMYPEDPRAPFYSPGGGAKEVPPLARLHLARAALVSRGCDEELLQSLVVEEAESTQSVDRPECAVGEWGAWSACSVSCGKGLRMRARQYRMPQKAQMFSCDRQLVSKEMCVAAVPECEGDNTPVEDIESNLTPVDTEGVCATSEWGPWSECSVTCGVGVSTRRRHFLDRMGVKKCPLVHTEENRKCMEPAACTEQESEISDPACPTSEWSGWSPCSASCGRGVRFRTRLLLVPADKQLECSARVELMQQRVCSEQQQCAVDMLTAKRICMEPPEVGPCRGVYQRWAFVPAKGVCAPFSYGGCRGGRNNFISQEDCLAACSVVLGGGAGAGAPAAGAVAGAVAGAPAPAVSTNYPGLSVNYIVPVPPRVNAAAAAGGGGAPSPAAADCQLSAWSEWSRCSVTCGVGYQERTRAVLAQPGPGGAPCPQRLSRRRRCSRQC